MPLNSVETLAAVAAQVMAEKNHAIRLGIQVIKHLQKQYPGTELARVAQSLEITMQIAHDRTTASELKKLLKRSEGLAESNTVPNSPPAP